METNLNSERVRVWDLFVRFFHWAVVAGFFIAYFTEDDFLTLHVWAGYTVGVLVVMRILWGFVGPKHARFTDFACGPVKAARYVFDLLTFRAKRYVGHSPAGGLMVLVLLGGLGLTVWSGLELYAIEENAGPLASLTWTTSIQAARADDDKHESKQKKNNGDEFWKDIHEAFANVMLFLIVLHVAGVVLAGLVHRENLVRSMINGYKRVNRSEPFD
jgi:cytochrome b